MPTMTGWQAVVKALKAEDIHFVYGLPGSPKDLYDALYDEPSIKAIQARHEAAGGFMAMAHALSTGKPSVCFASPGPGCANLTPALLESLATCAPVVALCPGTDGRLEGKGAFQETDHIGIMTPVTKWAVRVPYVEKIPWVFIERSPSPPTDSLVQFLSKFQWKLGEAKLIFLTISRYPFSSNCGDPKQINQVVNLLKHSENPFIVAGGGARSSGAHDELKHLPNGSECQS